jgi:hypothetical protein
LILTLSGFSCASCRISLRATAIRYEDGNEDDLLARLRKIEELIAGAGTAGEREAAGAALERVKARRTEQARRDPPVKWRFSMLDVWSRQLFVALCRCYGLKAFRYPRQKRTTVLQRVPRWFNDTVLWPEFVELDRALVADLQEMTTRSIRSAVRADTSEAEEVPAALPGLSPYASAAASVCHRKDEPILSDAVAALRHPLRDEAARSPALPCARQRGSAARDAGQSDRPRLARSGTA